MGSTKTVRIRILNEVYMMVVGLHGDHLKHFYDKYAIFAANYFFHPKFKLGQWDGKIRFFGSEGRTYLFLIEEILPALKRFGYIIEIDDARKTEAYQPDFIDNTIFQHILHPDTEQPITLRDDQVDGVNKLIESGYGVCVAGTGAGKTLMCAALVTAYDTIGAKSITIVLDQTLVRQTKRALS